MMRRAYNAGRWSAARHHARQLLNRPKELELARSVIVRSYWNEGLFEHLLASSEDWTDVISVNYRTMATDRLTELSQPNYLSESKMNRIERLRTAQPNPSHPFEWNATDQTRNFIQEENRVWFRYPEGYVYWDLPQDFVLEKTHPALLGLVAEVLLSPWYSTTKNAFPDKRPKGQRCSLSFSAGTDSSAAALVMPEHTLLAYHRRSFDSMLDHRNAERLIHYLQSNGEREVIEVESNHELIRTHHEKPIGFATDFACATHLMLLADYHDLGAIGFGTPIDNTYLWKGRKFRDFSQTPYFAYWTDRFSQAGLDLLFPIASFSEAGALMIIKQSSWLKHLNSCMRGDGVRGCGRCWKCFHKNGPLGRPFNISSPEIQHFLSKRPLPTALHAVWALQTLKLEDEVPDLAHLLQKDYSWWTQVYSPGFDLIPMPWRSHIERSIRSKLSVMPEFSAIHDVNLFDEN